MAIAVIDAELAENKNHNFANLACMKLSTVLKDSGKQVLLKTDYSNLSDFKLVYISKFFLIHH